MMTGTDIAERRRAAIWLLFWGSLSTAWCWSAAFAIGPTYDEPTYLHAGLDCWHKLSHRPLLGIGTMPLAGEAQTVPLFLSELFGGPDPLLKMDSWLPVARMTAVVFWWLLLWSSGRLATFYGGPVAGRFAVALLACEPVLLGHASLATTDIPFAACLVSLLASFRLRRDEPNWRRRLLVPAVWYAATFLAKASALMFVPICLIAVEAERLLRSGWRPQAKASGGPTPYRSTTDLAFVAFLGGLLLFAVCWKARWALEYQIRHNATGHGSAFILGEERVDGFWYYFPAALTIKCGVPLLLLPLVAVVLRPRTFFNGATVAALGLLAATPFMHVQIGVRFVFAIAILMTIGAAAAFGLWYSETKNDRGRKVGFGFAVAMVAWSALNAVMVWPQGICFTNELYGGTKNGYRCLSDSNYDWGQNLHELSAWHSGEADAPLHVYYFGTDPKIDRRDFAKRPLADLSSPEAFANANRGHFVAISTNFARTGPTFEYLETRTVVGRTTCYLIYDFRYDRAKE